MVQVVICYLDLRCKHLLLMISCVMVHRLLRLQRIHPVLQDNLADKDLMHLDNRIHPYLPITDRTGIEIHQCQDRLQEQKLLICLNVLHRI